MANINPVKVINPSGKFIVQVPHSGKGVPSEAKVVDFDDKIETFFINLLLKDNLCYFISCHIQLLTVT